MQWKQAGLELDGADGNRKVSPSSPASIQHRANEDLQHCTVKE